MASIKKKRKQANRYLHKSSLKEKIGRCKGLIFYTSSYRKYVKNIYNKV